MSFSISSQRFRRCICSLLHSTYLSRNEMYFSYSRAYFRFHLFLADFPDNCIMAYCLSWNFIFIIFIMYLGSWLPEVLCFLYESFNVHMQVEYWKLTLCWKEMYFCSQIAKNIIISHYNLWFRDNFQWYILQFP